MICYNIPNFMMIFQSYFGIKNHNQVVLILVL
jgi:hypothetical protein